jgi:putative transposase
VLACYRYIELNPIRAGMVSAPTQYRWSSYGANAEGKPDGLVQSHAAYDDLGVEAGQRARAYKTLCETGLPALVADEIRKATRVGCAVGTRRRNRGRPAKPR